MENSRSFLSNKKNLWLPPVAPGLPSLLLQCCVGNIHPVSFLYSRGRAPSNPRQAGECAKLHKAPPSRRLRGKSLPPSSSWRCRSNQGWQSLLPQHAVFPSPQQQHGLPCEDLKQPDQGELVQAASLHNRTHRGYFCRLETLTINPPKAVRIDIQEEIEDKRGSTLVVYEGIGV